jgi:hypothetical protein
MVQRNGDASERRTHAYADFLGLSICSAARSGGCSRGPEHWGEVPRCFVLALQAPEGASAMKLVSSIGLAILLSASHAFAGAGAPVPQGSQQPQPSGRPGAVLDNATCDSVWKMASPNGDTLSQDKAVPYVVNFQMVDTSGDGKITPDEFKTACGKGWIQQPDSSTVKDMKKD